MGNKVEKINDIGGDARRSSADFRSGMKDKVGMDGSQAGHKLSDTLQPNSAAGSDRAQPALKGTQHTEYEHLYKKNRI